MPMLLQEIKEPLVLEVMGQGWQNKERLHLWLSQTLDLDKIELYYRHIWKLTGSITMLFRLYLIPDR